MRIEEVEKGLYAKFVLGHPDHTVFHTTAWLECVEKVFGTEIRFLGGLDGGRLQAVAPLFIRRTPIGTLYGSPLPQNATPPLFPLVGEGEEGEFLAAIGEWVREMRVRHFQIPWRKAGAAAPRGARIEHRKNLEIELAPTAEEDWKRIKPEARNRIRRALKEGVRCHWLRGDSVIDEYVPLLDSTYRVRQGIRPNFPIEMHREALQRREEIGLRLIAASREGSVLSILWLVAANGRCTYWDGASDQERRRYAANHLLHWEALRWCRREGIRTYDLVGDRGRAGAREGIPRFKRSLGARPVDHAVIYWQRPLLRGALSLYRSFLTWRDRPRRVDS